MFLLKINMNHVLSNIICQYCQFANLSTLENNIE